MSELSPMGLLFERIESIEEKAEEVPVLKSQVEGLTKAVDRLTDVVVQAALALVVTGVLGLLTALILKGVIG
jgi:hypothetical protein